MMILIILIALTVLGGYLSTTWKCDILGFIMCIFFGIYLVIHILGWGLMSYEHEVFVLKRQAFEKTLNSSRENGNEYETAAIVKEVANWNIALAEKKYNNKTFLLGQYVDDRVELLEPIK